MSSNKKPDHIHKYKKVNLTRNESKKPYLVFKCMVPSCMHYLPMAVAEGKLCECNRCGNPMVLTKLSLTLARPHCVDCTKSTKLKTIDTIAEFLERNEI